MPCYHLSRFCSLKMHCDRRRVFIKRIHVYCLHVVLSFHVFAVLAMFVVLFSEDIGVFFCGPKILSSALHVECNRCTDLQNGTRFYYNKENF